MDYRKKVFLVVFIGSVIGSFIIGFIASFGLTFHSFLMMRILNQDSLRSDEYITQKIFDNLDIDEMKNYLSLVSSVSGSDYKIEQWIKEKFSDSFENVDESQYQVLFTTHDKDEEDSRVELINENDVIDKKEYVEDNNVYAKSGRVLSDVLFINYGRVEDFEEVRKLKKNQDTSNQKIALVRLGRVHPGAIVQNAHQFNYKGVILFRDSNPSSGSQGYSFSRNPRINLDKEIPKESFKLFSGDPQTPGWPSLDGVYRVSFSKSQSLPQIPSITVSAEFAKNILKNLGELDCPNDWVIELVNSCKIGGFLQDRYKEARIIVNNKFTKDFVNNIIALIPGSVEPDRYVIIGSHRPSWSKGAISGTGTVALIQIAEMFSKIMKETKWKPRRSIIFASWGAGEMGQIGSTEWIEEHLPKINERTVAYINSDKCSSGPFFGGSASPPLQKLLLEGMKFMKDPNDEKQSYFDFWSQPKYQRAFKKNKINDISIGDSDFVPFLIHGIPSIDLKFKPDQFNMSSAIEFQGTSADTLQNYLTYIDQDLKHLKSCEELLAYSIRHLSDTKVLPHDFESYSNRIERGFHELRVHDIISDNDLMREQNISINELDMAVMEFSKQVSLWNSRINDTDFYNPLEVRMLNDQIMSVNRIFLMKMPTRNGTTHSIYSLSNHDMKNLQTFPGIRDLLTSLEISEKSENEKKYLYSQLRKHISDLIIRIYQAASHLKELYKI